MLLIFSLLFYAWGEPVYVLLMAFTTLVCYICARMIAKGKNVRLSTAVAVIWGIGTLVVFKYTAFLVQSFNSLTHLAVPVPNIALPVGISFFTFQAISYVLDVKRGDAEAAASYADVLLYISLFPQLIAGPIVRYSDVAAEIKQRTVTTEDIAAGLRRFCFGMGKKVLIANTLAYTADKVFALDSAAINAPIAWLGAVCYLMQIYFDFSGYSDMAIGLGRAFGFTFRENFMYPYCAASMQDFWRRWHISLSTWFKEYVYIPLGGNRRGKLRTGLNKLIVFLAVPVKLRHHIVNGDAKNHLAVFTPLDKLPWRRPERRFTGAGVAHTSRNLFTGSDPPFGKRSNPLLFCSNFLLWRLQVGYHCRRKQLFQLFEKGINKPLC